MNTITENFGDALNPGRRFYENIEKTIVRRGRDYIEYELIHIPNELKTNAEYRKIIIQKINQDTRLNLKRQQYDGYPIIIHISRGLAQMIILSEYNSRRVEDLIAQTTRLVTKEELHENRISIKTETNVLIALEILMPEPNSPRYRSPTLEIYQYEITNEDSKKRRSVIRNNCSERQVREKIIFMDAEFATRVDGKHSPVSVTVINYEGNTLLDTLCCPRQKIRSYESRCHGLSEKELRGKPDSEIVTRDINEIINGKILVGSDLQMEIKGLKIDISKLSGIRDLCTAKCVRDLVQTENQFMKLQHMANVILKRKIQQGFHTSDEDVRAIREIYLTVENDWVDDNVWVVGTPTNSNNDEPSNKNEPSTSKKRASSNNDNHGKRGRVEEPDIMHDLTTQTENPPKRISVGTQTKLEIESKEMIPCEVQTEKSQDNDDEELLFAVKKNTMISVKGKNIRLKINPEKW